MLRERFLDQPDVSDRKFLEKLRDQLADSPPEVHQLMAEALYFHPLIVSTKDGRYKRRTIETVLGWSSSPVAIPDELAAAFTPGIANPGQYFHVKRPNQVGFLIEFVEQWEELEADARTRLLADPWAFKDFVIEREFRSKTLVDEPNSVDVTGLVGERMRPEPARVHRHDYEGLSASKRDDLRGGDDADVADGDLVVTFTGGTGQDLPEPLHLHPIRQLHHHGPAVEVVPRPGFPGFPGVLRTDRDVTPDVAQAIQGTRAHLLEKGHVGVHGQQLLHRLEPHGNVPAHQRDHDI